MVHILQYFYPETIFCAFFLNVPSIFAMIWKLMQPLLPERTKRKAKFLNVKDSANFEKTFSEYIDKDDLLETYGGNQTFDWSFEWEVSQFHSWKTNAVTLISQYKNQKNNNQNDKKNDNQNDTKNNENNDQNNEPIGVDGLELD